ncbi:MAG: glycosyltransferase [Rhodospirillales bacterium]|nr:glycosyltransferase [Acetobacter sp.]
MARETGLPTLLNDLPYIAQDLAVPADATDAEFTPDRPVRVAIFGYLNVNRRVLEFFHALAGMEERACFEVHLYGTLLQRYEDDVKRDVAALGLRDQVRFHGYVTEEALDAGLADCDLAVNLRFPTMGEASASQLRIWNHALPSLVTRIDGYAAMPEEAVSFVRPDHERADIQEHLRGFLAQSDEHRQKGARGRQILLERHRPAIYVERLAGLCEHLATLRSRHVRLEAAARVGRGIAPWSHLTPRSESEQHYSRTVAELF